jgi:hypothetical protein
MMRVGKISPPSREGQGWVPDTPENANVARLTPAPGPALKGGEEE